jgi:SAM-dependent methyltransferase
LEIGAGSGIATLPLAKRGYNIVALELGAELAVVARKNLAPYSNVEIVVGAFENCQLPDEPFDLVVSATSFHWLDPVTRYAKSAAALGSNESLAVFRYYHVAGGDQEFFEQTQTCYQLYNPDSKDKFTLPTVENWQTDLRDQNASKLFGDPQVSTYISEETYTREQYLNLISTDSYHRTRDQLTRQRMFDCIGSIIDKNFAGQIRKRYLTELVIACKL